MDYGNRTSGTIEISEIDKAQPYRVWYKNHIRHFDRTLTEANQYLDDLQHGRIKQL
jgi:hypothetical protein